MSGNNASRSQSRMKQTNKNIFNQFKNVVNLNGQVIDPNNNQIGQMKKLNSVPVQSN